MEKTIQLIHNHYMEDNYNPSRHLVFTITEDCLKEYLAETEDDRTVDSFLNTYDSDESECVYNYALDDNRILSKKIIYDIDVLEKYALYKGINQECDIGIETFYWDIYNPSSLSVNARLTKRIPDGIVRNCPYEKEDKMCYGCPDRTKCNANIFEKLASYEDMDDTKVYKVCPHCEHEIVMVWDIKKLGFEAYCPICGNKLMLCSQCLFQDDADYCDYENHKCHRMKGVINANE